MSYWPRTQIEKELEYRRARNEVLRWLIEARGVLRGSTPTWISFDEAPEPPDETTHP